MYLVQLSITTPNTIKERLKAEAARRGLSVSKLASTILEEGLVIFEDQDLSVSHKYEPVRFK